MGLDNLALRWMNRRGLIAFAERFLRAGARSQGGNDRLEVALTFDDGPHPEWTPKILDALDRASLKATFFVVGRSLEKNPGLVVEARRRGHEIGTHLYSHGRKTVFDDVLFSKEVMRSKTEIERLLNEPIRWLRFPYGERGRQVPRRIRETYDLEAVHWTYSSHDTKVAEPEGIVARIAAGLRPGAIILMHDALADEKSLRPPYVASRRATLAAIPLIGDLLTKKGFSSVTLSALLRGSREKRSYEGL